MFRPGVSCCLTSELGAVALDALPAERAGGGNQRGRPRKISAPSVAPVTSTSPHARRRRRFAAHRRSIRGTGPPRRRTPARAVLKGVAGDRFLLVGVAEIPHLNEHCRHVRRLEHAKRRLIGRAHRHGTRSFNCATRTSANATECARWRVCARSHGTISISRRPPPSVGSAAASFSGDRVLVEAAR